ncbi:radial spoke head protein 4 homolog A-like [Convolutriloba macropyga]|uniref:radial spoke head protein 4 homolog A-like n=1 Tax=Convolutriloba macropyga TaxID=536237 RepID=UPI003F52650A
MPTESEKIFQDAQSYLKSVRNGQGINLYEHISAVLTKVLEERPAHVVDIFEDLSLSVKDQKLSKFGKEPEDLWLTQAKLSEELKPLFTGGEDEEGGMEVTDEEMGSPLPNVMENAYMFEQAGIGLSREEYFLTSLALKQLIDSHPLQKCRFWGKVLGIEKNYYIAEVEYREGEEEEEEEEVQEEAEKEEEEKDEENAEGEEEDVLPKNDWKAPPPVPKEDKGTGANKYTYFVTNNPGQNWTKLPTVTPAQVFNARKIKKYFTGHLDKPIVSYPPFPGTEANYLRAQIARISAGTQISPANFYTFDEEEEAEEDDGAKDHYIENQEFEPMPIKELADPKGTNWTHHVQYILPQGRCSFVNPNQKSEEDFEDEEEEEEKEEMDELEPETGPSLLTPISEDAIIDELPPWTIKSASERVPFFSVVFVRSNLWPGAYAYGQDRKFENLYIGFGHKYASENYTPPQVPVAFSEYTSGPEVEEMDDPSAEEEAAAKAAAQGEEGGEEEGVEEEEEDEDD